MLAVVMDVDDKNWWPSAVLSGGWTVNSVISQQPEMSGGFWTTEMSLTCH
jgi:hypothetical protein